MELGTINAAERSTGSRTMADLVPLAGRKHADRPAIKHKVGEQWVDIPYTQLADTVRNVALGLVDVGIEPGDKVSILANTRPEWTYACFGILGAGATCVSIYQTNSAEECHYVLAHSESRAVFVEDAEQLAKIREVEAELPALELIVVMEPSGDIGDAIALEELCTRGKRRPDSDYEERLAGVKDDDMCLYIYTSGTTGPPKGCLLTHRNYRRVTEMVESDGVLSDDEVIYLFLPLAHAFALLIQFVAFDIGSSIAYWEKDPQKIIPNLMEVRPTYFPSVPRIFEKIYTLANSVGDPDEIKQAVEVGFKVRQMEEAGEEVPAELRKAFEDAEEKLYQKVRALFGGRVRQAVTGAAPISKEILEFFYACGVPVMEGYGMTETSTVASANRPDAFRFGSVGKPLHGVEARIAEDGELLLRGPNIFQGYFKNEDATREALADGWLHTGDLGSIDEDGFIYITGRKKDIIITAGGKNITPANLENSLKQNRWISQAVVVGDRRPYLVALITLDPEELPAFAEQHGISVEDVPQSEAMRGEVQKAVAEANSHVGRVEQIKKFVILPHDLSQQTGELTPTLKVKRNVVNEKFAEEIEALYAG
ncbi:MAG TPA: AMP-dependent synthetase/ligase [Thermoleophilaceae bacterium]